MLNIIQKTRLVGIFLLGIYFEVYVINLIYTQIVSGSLDETYLGGLFLIFFVTVIVQIFSWAYFNSDIGERSGPAIFTTRNVMLIMGLTVLATGFLIFNYYVSLSVLLFSLFVTITTFIQKKMLYTTQQHKNIFIKQYDLAGIFFFGASVMTILLLVTQIYSGYGRDLEPNVTTLAYCILSIVIIKIWFELITLIGRWNNFSFQFLLKITFTLFVIHHVVLTIVLQAQALQILG